MKSIQRFLNSVQIRPFLGLFALVAGGTYLSGMWRACGGHLSPPLDDTYIYLQYARRVAEGHGFSYSGAAPPSTGATSLLHVLLLVPGWWAGLRDSAYLVLPLVLGILLLVLMLAGMTSAAVSALPADARTPARATSGAIALALTGLCGQVLWGALTGMDTILFMAGLAGVLAFLARPGGVLPVRFWLLLGLLSWLRPEGVVYGSVALSAALLRDFRTARLLATTAPHSRRPGAIAGWWGPVAALLLLALPFFVNLALVGSFQSDGMLSKSLFSEPRSEVLRTSLPHVPEIWRRIALLYVTDFGNGQRLGAFRVLQTGLVAAGLLSGLLLGLAGRRGAVGFTSAVWALLFVGLTAMTLPWNVHNYRYQIPGMVPVALLTALGWGALIARLPARPARGAAAALGIAFLAVQLPGAWHMRTVYAANCQNIRDQQERVGRWIRANTPADARIALNDAGAIAYYGERATLDLVGLTTHDWAIRAREGSGALFEQLERLPSGERPTHFALYPTWFRGLAATRLFGQRVFEADLLNNTICGSRTKIVYEADWSVAGSGAQPRLPEFAGSPPLDEVDVGDRASEAAHGYTAGRRQADLLEDIPLTGSDGSRYADGGRRVSDRETFRVTLAPGRPARLVLRTTSPEPLALRVSLNGAPIGRIEVPASAGRWSEEQVELPASRVAGVNALTIERDPPDPRKGFPSFHYWAYP